jgi:hypothetical protein
MPEGVLRTTPVEDTLDIEPSALLSLDPRDGSPSSSPLEDDEDTG